MIAKMDDVFGTGFTLEEYADMWLSRIQYDLFENQGADVTEEQMNLVLKAMAQRLKEVGC